MSDPKPPLVLFIVDADVLIDYAIADRSILALVVRHVGPIHIPLPVLGEVDQLTEDDCMRAGITLLDPTLEELAAAAAPLPGLSFEDKLCLTLALANGFTCVTNDKALRRSCEGVGVSNWWGLSLMVELVERRELSAEAALKTARAIRESNPRHMTQVILEKFENRVRSVARRRRGP